MRLLFGVGSKLFIWNTAVTKVNMKFASDEEDESEEEFEQAPPQDPHSTVGAHCELSPHAIFEGASATRRFGFGSQGEVGREAPPNL